MYWKTKKRAKWEKTRHKSITVVLSFEGGVPRFLVVLDRRHHDWTFVTGGCQNKKEISHPLLCALRELKEETKGIVDISKGKYSTYYFKTDKVMPNFVFIYHVFVVEVPFSPEMQISQVNQFQHEMVNPTHLPLKCYNETENMLWVTFEEFSTMKKWDIVQTHIMDNPEFYAMIGSYNRRSFNIRKRQNEQQKQSVYRKTSNFQFGYYQKKRYNYTTMGYGFGRRKGNTYDKKGGGSFGSFTETKRF